MVFAIAGVCHLVTAKDNPYINSLVLRIPSFAISSTDHLEYVGALQIFNVHGIYFTASECRGVAETVCVHELIAPVNCTEN